MFFVTDKREPIEMDAAACLNPKCNGQLNLTKRASSQTIQCPKCAIEIPRSHIKAFDEMMVTTRMHLDKMENSSMTCKYYY